MSLVIGPVLRHADGYAFDAWTAGKGATRSYPYNRIEHAYYARNAEIKASARGRAPAAIVCQTFDEFIVKLTGDEYPIDNVYLAAKNPWLQRQLHTPLGLGDRPFVVGRRPVAGEGLPPRQPDLMLDDTGPFRLSRNHFMIEQRHKGYYVRDLRSTLGTIVNGQPIGDHFCTDDVLLRVEYRPRGGPALDETDRPGGYFARAVGNEVGFCLVPTSPFASWTRGASMIPTGARGGNAPEHAC